MYKVNELMDEGRCLRLSAIDLAPLSPILFLL